MAFKYRADIDGLRAVAVVPVVLGHAGIPGFDGGFVGVDVFFVISGFLITALICDDLKSQEFSFSGFYLRRIRRLLPALFSVMIATFLMGWVLLPPTGLEALGRSIVAVLMLGSNVWLWQTTGDYFGAAAEITPLLHTWSLAVEEQFYLIFPVLLVLIFRSGLSPLKTIGTLTLAGFSLSYYVTPLHPSAAFYLMPTRAWEFGVGALLALVPSIKSHRFAGGSVAVGLGLIAFAVVTFERGTPMPGAHALLPVLGAACVIAGGASANPFSRLLGGTLPVAVGLMSYSLYLWHWPVQVAMRLISGIYHLPIVLGIVSVVLSLMLAYATRRWIEEPLRRERSLAMTAATLSPLCLALVCLGAASIKGAGVPSRIDPVILAEYTAATQHPPLHTTCMSRKTQEPPCALSNGGNPEVLVWGDSHAGAALPAFELWAKETQRVAVAATQAACPPILGVLRADRSQRSCAASNAETMAWLRESPSVHTVILHARWPFVVTGQRAPGEAGGSAQFASPQGEAVRMEAALSSTVSALRMMGKRVLLIGSVPELGLDVTQAFLAQSRLFGGFAMHRLPADPKLRTKEVDAILWRIAQRHGAEFIELPRYSDQALQAPLLYADDDHLSVHGAMTWVLPALRQALPPASSQSAPIAVLSAVRPSENQEQLFGPH